MKRFGIAVLKFAALALVCFCFVRLVIANPPPLTPQQMAPSNEKLCSEVLRMKCRVTPK